MERLSLPIEQIKNHYNVIVVGSGYGGGISASRMARTGRSVCLLERGKEIHPGEYPDEELEAQKEMQMDIEGTHVGSETGLYDFRFNNEVNVFQGCGLGGTSLVNANVWLPAEEWVMNSEDFPAELRNDQSTLKSCMSLARDMLRPTPYPEDWPTPAKLKSMEIAAKAWPNKALYRPPINVTFEDGVNHVGVEQKACRNCGDCVTGCNYWAKNTTLMNYLPDARNHGADIFTEVAVDHVERLTDKWAIHYKILGAGREKFTNSTSFITADIIILGAGTLGSTEILLRSKKAGLPLSDMVGKRFTGNGDFLGFGYNNDYEANAIGIGHDKPDPNDPVGPCITGVIDLRKDLYTNGKGSDGMVIEEGVIPAALSAYMPLVLSFYSKFSKDTDSGFRDFLREFWRRIGSIFRGAYHGATRNTMTYLVMTHDDGQGELYLKDNRVRIKWGNVGKESIFKKVSDNLRKVTEKLGGTYIKNPTWNKLFKNRITTVHPLGGCIMGEDATKGVVNHKGQVFAASSGNTVYEGLYVNDGSIVPRPLGVNPLLTISTLAERNCQYIAKDRGWTIDYSLGGKQTEKKVETKPGIQFTERMAGYLSVGAENFEDGYKQGKLDDSAFSFVLTIHSNDLDTMIKDPSHSATIVGSVTAPALSKHNLSVSNGEFNLFTKDPDQKDIRYMRYRMKLNSEEGKEYYFNGYKLIRDDPGFDVWEDTTTLFITIHDGDTDKAPVLGKGILKINPDDFRKQMTTMKVPGAKGTKDELKYRALFLKFFAENIVDVYV